MSPTHCSTRRPANRGFSLIVVISLMVLLSLLAVGLLSLSSISLRASSSQKWQNEARQNARMALAIAIGELQKASGPDKRITAPASIRGKDLPQRHLTGVWEGWKWDGLGSPPDYDDEKDSRFIRWLVSANDRASVESTGFVEAAPGGDLVTLIGDQPDNSDRVESQRVVINRDTGDDQGGYSWAIFDESTKLPISLPQPEHGTPSIAAAQLAAAPLPGYAATSERNWTPLAELGDQRTKLITTAEAALTDLPPADRGFHDLTSVNTGLMVDAGTGKLSVDLSRLFARADGLPDDYSSRYLYSGTSTPLAPAPARFNGANPFPSPDPSWRLLHSHYRLFDKVGGDTRPFLDTTLATRPDAGTAGTADHPFFHEQQIAPAIAKAQFVFSMGFAWHGHLDKASASNNRSKPPGQRDEYITWLVVDPVITLWNPYNVNLRFTGGRIDLYRVPLSFRLYKNGTLINSQYTHLANTFLNSDFNNRKDTFYRLNLLPEEGESELNLAPGEHIVLTAHNHAKHYRHKYMTKGLDLRPGFSPPAGNASVDTVGGTSTINVCVAADGSPTGRDYGKAVRTIAVKPGDRIEVEVAAQRAQVDKPKETGGREVSGFLKYYIGDPSSPRLVGGIELDYGGDESKFLDTIPRNDLPEFIVSGDIPRNFPGGNYQGRRPPPVVCFKEPFLISTFQLKTERDSKFPSRSWLSNAPPNLYASAGIDQTEPWPAHQYEFQWEAMYDWPPSSPTIEVSNTGNRGYGGSGIYAQSGSEFATHSSIPLSPLLSLPQLRHAPLNASGQLPLTSQIVANSFASPLIPAGSVRGGNEERTFLDHSFLANNALFDRTFFSSITEPIGPLADTTDNLEERLKAFFDDGTPLTNPRFVPYRGNRATEDIISDLTSPDGHLRTAAHLMINAPFNINCTNVDVWEAFLASTFDSDAPVITDGTITTATGRNIVSSRHLPANGDDLESSDSPVASDLAKWNGYRRIEPSLIRKLAEEIVVEVRARGPFQSLAEFINRRPETGEFGRSGALQAALDRTPINDPALDPVSEVVMPDMINPDAASGNTADGAPGILTQADLLTPIASSLVARGDTFRIRTYGDAGPASGSKVRAWCEAVVQRIPDYLDSISDRPWDEPAAESNLRFGRRYQVISFRWLSPAEI